MGSKSGFMLGSYSPERLERKVNLRRLTDQINALTAKSRQFPISYGVERKRIPFREKHRKQRRKKSQKKGGIHAA